MSTGQDLWRVGVQASVVDIETEADGAGKTQVLFRRSDCCVSEKERHSHEGPNDHGVSATEESSITHEAGDHRPKYTTNICDEVVTPLIILETCKL
jgi:hypothetical protein